MLFRSDKAKDTLMSVLLLAMMLPFVAIMIPLFKMMSHWGLVKDVYKRQVQAWVCGTLRQSPPKRLLLMYKRRTASRGGTSMFRSYRVFTTGHSFLNFAKF